MGKKKKKKKRSAQITDNLLKIAALALGIYLLSRKSAPPVKIPPVKVPQGDETPTGTTGRQSPISGLRQRLRQRQTI